MAPVIYFSVNFLLACIVAWRIGVHLAKEHEGEWTTSCKHWICDLCNGGKYVPAIVFLGGAIIVPIFILFSFLNWLFGKLIRAPYLRSLPPEGGHPAGNVIKPISDQDNCFSGPSLVSRMREVSENIGIQGQKGVAGSEAVEARFMSFQFVRHNVDGAIGFLESRIMPGFGDWWVGTAHGKSSWSELDFKLAFPRVGEWWAWTSCANADFQLTREPILMPAIDGGLYAAADEGAKCGCFQPVNFGRG